MNYIDEAADRYVEAIKLDALKCNPDLRTPYCVWCRETLPKNNLCAMCKRCDQLFDQYEDDCSKRNVKGDAKGFNAYVQQHLGNQDDSN